MMNSESPFRFHPVRSKDGRRVNQAMLDFLEDPTHHRKVNTTLTLPGRNPTDTQGKPRQRAGG